MYPDRIVRTILHHSPPPGLTNGESQTRLCKTVNEIRDGDPLDGQVGSHFAQHVHDKVYNSRHDNVSHEQRSFKSRLLALTSSATTIYERHLPGPTVDSDAPLPTNKPVPIQPPNARNWMCRELNPRWVCEFGMGSTRPIDFSSLYSGGVSGTPSSRPFSDVSMVGRNFEKCQKESS